MIYGLVILYGVLIWLTLWSELPERRERDKPKVQNQEEPFGVLGGSDGNGDLLREGLVGCNTPR